MLGISLRTAQLWSESGVLDAWKTEGGHRRISRASLLRMLEDRAQRPKGKKEASLAEEYKPWLSNLKVLVIDDDRVLIKLYKRAIVGWKLPIEIITATNGADGLIRIGREAPDLLITDLAMPDVNGVQLVSSVIRSSFLDDMEILVVTSMTSTLIAERGGLPADIPILPKPVPFNVLQAHLIRLVTRRAALMKQGKGS